MLSAIITGLGQHTQMSKGKCDMLEKSVIDWQTAAGQFDPEDLVYIKTTWIEFE